MHGALPNLRHIWLLCAVARCRSISAVARSSHLSQPAVTLAISALEREFNGRLFVRTARGLEPTAAGSSCSRRLERAIERIDLAVAAAMGPGRDARHVSRGITSTQLRSLIAAAEAGGFGNAARLLGVTRATVHRSARALERVLGVALFETTSHGVRPTREAVRLALQAELAAAEIAQAHAEVAAAQGVERGGTVIGAMPLARSVIVPAAVLGFSVRHPRHALSILDGPYEHLIEALRRGRADVLVGALRDGPPDDVCQEHLFDDPLAIIARTGHPLTVGTGAATRAPSRADLARYDWIAPRKGSPLRRQYEALIDGAERTAPIECNSLVAARAILMASDRLMLLSAHQVQHELAAGQLAVLPPPRGAVVRSIGLTMRRDWMPTEVQRDLLEELRLQARNAGTSLALGLPIARRRRGKAAARRSRAPRTGD